MANKFTDFNPGIVNSGGRKNFIINGNMDIWQRGDTGTSVGSCDYRSVDRWIVRTATGGGSMTVSKQSIVSSDSGAPRLKYCARVARNNNDTSQLQFVQMVESIDAAKFAGAAVTLSFYARKHANWTAQSSNLITRLYEGTGIDERWYSYTNSNYTINSNAVLTTSWQRFNFTTTLRSTTTEFAVHFEFAGVGTNPTNDYFEITGVQLEIGSVATPFEFRPFAEELALCQRYYEKSYNLSEAPGSNTGNSYGMLVYFSPAAYTNYPSVPYSVRKKSAGAVTIYRNNGTSGAIDGGANPAAGAVDLGETGFKVNSTFAADTLYKWHWAVDAEL